MPTSPWPGRNDDPTVSDFDFTLPRTWSGAVLWHTAATPLFDGSALSNCDGGWAGGTCAIFAKLADTFAGHRLDLRSLDLEYDDQLPNRRVSRREPVVCLARAQPRQ